MEVVIPVTLSHIIRVIPDRLVPIVTREYARNRQVDVNVVDKYLGTNGCNAFQIGEPSCNPYAIACIIDNDLKTNSVLRQQFISLKIFDIYNKSIRMHLNQLNVENISGPLKSYIEMTMFPTILFAYLARNDREYNRWSRLLCKSKENAEIYLQGEHMTADVFREQYKEWLQRVYRMIWVPFTNVQNDSKNDLLTKTLNNVTLPFYDILYNHYKRIDINWVSRAFQIYVKAPYYIPIRIQRRLLLFRAIFNTPDDFDATQRLCKKVSAPPYIHVFGHGCRENQFTLPPSVFMMLIYSLPTSMNLKAVPFLNEFKELVYGSSDHSRLDDVRDHRFSYVFHYGREQHCRFTDRELLAQVLCFCLPNFSQIWEAMNWNVGLFTLNRLHYMKFKMKWKLNIKDLLYFLLFNL